MKIVKKVAPVHFFAVLVASDGNKIFLIMSMVSLEFYNVCISILYNITRYNSKGIIQDDRETICDRCFSPPTYSYGSPITIPSYAQIQYGVLMSYFRVGVVIP